MAPLLPSDFPSQLRAAMTLGIEMRVRGYCSERTPERHVTVNVNDKECAIWTFVSGEAVVKHLDVPLLVPHENLNFVFSIKSPERPSDTGASNDTRQLGIGLLSIRISLAGMIAEQA